MQDNKGDPKVDAMTEEELARYFEENKDNPEVWSARPGKIRVRRGSLSTIFSLRLAPEELMELQAAARAQGRSVSDLIREGALKEARSGEGANVRALSRDITEVLERYGS